VVTTKKVVSFLEEK